MTIGEAAKQAEVETSTIRYYERIGLLPRPERVNGRRVYQETVLKWLMLIKATKAAGFTIAEIQTLTARWEAEGRSPTDWRQFVQHKLVETENMIRQAIQMQAILNAALECGCWDDYVMSLDSFVASTTLYSTGSHKVEDHASNYGRCQGNY